MLTSELEGYEDYMRKVKHRPIPFIWSAPTGRHPIGENKIAALPSHSGSRRFARSFFRTTSPLERLTRRLRRRIRRANAYYSEAGSSTSTRR